MRHALLLADKQVNAAALCGNRYYLLAEGTRTYLSSLRTSESDTFSVLDYIRFLFRIYAASALTEGQKGYITCEGNIMLFLTQVGSEEMAVSEGSGQGNGDIIY